MFFPHTSRCSWRHGRLLISGVSCSSFEVRGGQAQVRGVEGSKRPIIGRKLQGLEDCIVQGRKNPVNPENQGRFLVRLGLTEFRRLLGVSHVVVGCDRRRRNEALFRSSARQAGSAAARAQRPIATAGRGAACDSVAWMPSPDQRNEIGPPTSMGARKWLAPSDPDHQIPPAADLPGMHVSSPPTRSGT